MGIDITTTSILGGGAFMCSETIATPIDTTVTVDAVSRACSSGAIEIDSVAAGAGIVVVNGNWRLS